MVNKHPSGAFCFDFNGFTEYLTSIAGGKKSVSTAKAIVADIQNYFFFISDSHKPHYNLLLDMENLKNYLQYLQQHFTFASTTITEKIRWLRLAVEYTLHIDNSDECDITMFMRCTKILTNLLKWGKSMSKDIQKQRHKQSVKSAQKVCKAMLIYTCIYIIYDMIYV